MPDKKKKNETALGIKYWLSDPDIREVSLVKSPFIPCSPQAGIQLTKAVKEGYNPELIPLYKAIADGADSIPENKVPFKKRFMIQKVDRAKQIVYGYVYAANMGDLEGDAMTPEELEKAAASLLMNLTDKKVEGDGVGLNHQIFEDIGKFTESSIDRDGGIGKSLGFGEVIPGAWFVAMKIHNKEAWKSVENGEIVGFSWGGYATRTPIEEAEQKTSAFKQVVKTIRSALSKQEPMDFQGWQSILEVGPKMDDMIWTLGDVIYGIIISDELTIEQKQEKVRESILQFYAAVVQLFNNLSSFDVAEVLQDLVEKFKSVNESLDKAQEALALVGETRNDINGALETIKNINDKGDDMTQEELNKAIGKALAEDETVKSLKETVEANKTAISGLTTEMAEFKKAKEPEDKKTDPPEDPKTEEATKALLEDLNARLEKMEKTPAIRKSVEGDGAVPEGVKIDKDGVARKEDGKVDWATMLKGTNVDPDRLER